MEDYIIETRSLSKTYGNVKAVNNVDLHIERGSIYGLVGENGSGKSTILKAIMGITNISSGDILIFGENSEKELGRARSKIGSVIESPSFYPYMSARENLEYYCIQKGIKDRTRVDRVLDIVGLEDVGKKKYKNFSLGMKQRLGIGLAILGEPEILILDEPINGLDPTGIVELRNMLLELNSKKNTSIILSSHILGELSQIATNYGFLNRGRLIDELSSKDLEERCREYVELVVEDTARGSFIIETSLKTLDYKITNDGRIQLFDYTDRINELMKIFYENDVEVKSISQKGMSLEDYYVNLMGGIKDA